MKFVNMIYVLFISLCFLTLSCQKTQECGYGTSSFPITRGETLPELSENEYNSVKDVMEYYNRIITRASIREYKYKYNKDTIKVYGWLYNNQAGNMAGDWLTDDKKYTTGQEDYPPYRLGLGYGIRLYALRINDYSKVWNKCYITGIMNFHTLYYEKPEMGNCDYLYFTINVLDNFFEEDEK